MMHQANLVMSRERSVPPRYNKLASGEVEYVLTVDVGEFSSSEVLVERRGSQLVVEARRSRVLADAGAGRRDETELKEFRKEMSLPGNTDHSKPLTTVFVDNGLMEVHVPTLPHAYTSMYPPPSRPISVRQWPSPQNISFNTHVGPLSPHTVSFNSPVTPISPHTVSFNRPVTPISPHTVSSNRTEPPVVRSSSYTTSTSNSNGSNIGQQHRFAPTLGAGYSDRIVMDPIFRPEEVTIRTKPGAKVVVSARHEENGGRHGYGSSVKEFNDERQLPWNVDIDALKVTFTEGGVLHLEAPYKQPPAGNNRGHTTQIPVQRF